MRRQRGRPSLLGRRQVLGVVMALGALLAGREVRQRLLVGPDGAWRRELWLDAVLEQPDGDPADAAVPGPGPLTASGTGAVPAQVAPDGPDAAAGSATVPKRRARSARATLTTPLAINSCSLDSLQLLPGVGPVLAARIDEARRQGTIFRNPSDLLEIRGIGPAAMARLTPLVRFTEPRRPQPILAQ
jgi:predicted flap endonuclease-1-like 5' DNA nuclease